MVTTVGRTTNESRSHWERSGNRDESDNNAIVSHVEANSIPSLEVLDDDNALEILQTLTDGPKRARELIDICEGSRSTVYRRLDQLVETGFVSEETALDPDGHHCKQFRLVRDTVTVTIGPDGFKVKALSS